MKKPIEQRSVSDLRLQIAAVRQRIADTNRSYESAKRQGAHEQLSQLIRRKSEFTRELLGVQRELLQTFRPETSAGNVKS